MELTRRHLIAGSAGLLLPLQGCAAQATGPRFTPESFGAIGDGISDDYDAFGRMIAAVNSAGGGTLVFSPGRTYFMNRYVVREAGAADDLVFSGCRGLTIDGNGATIAVKGDFERDNPATRSLSGLRFRDCRTVALRNLTLNGNVNRTIKRPGLREPSSHGLNFQSCSDVVVERVTARHFAGDGILIRESATTGPSGVRQASRRFAVRDSHFLFNGRQGLTVGQLRGGLFENCDFSYTGYIDPNGTPGPYGSHSPAAGVDVEPDNNPTHRVPVDVLTGEITFRRCRIIGNHGATFLASKYVRGQYFQEQIRLESCELECNAGLTGGRDGFIFDVPGGEVTGCTLRMIDKTAYLGWYRLSAASPRFVGNTVYGWDRLPGHPLLEVRPTAGAPVIERNRFVVQQRQSGSSRADRQLLLKINNPNAVVRENEFFVTADTGSSTTPSLMPIP